MLANIGNEFAPDGERGNWKMRCGRKETKFGSDSWRSVHGFPWDSCKLGIIEDMRQRLNKGGEGTDHVDKSHRSEEGMSSSGVDGCGVGAGADSVDNKIALEGVRVEETAVGFEEYSGGCYGALKDRSGRPDRSIGTSNEFDGVMDLELGGFDPPSRRVEVVSWCDVEVMFVRMPRDRHREADEFEARGWRRSQAVGEEIDGGEFRCRDPHHVTNLKGIHAEDRSILELDQCVSREACAR